MSQLFGKPEFLWFHSGRKKKKEKKKFALAACFPLDSQSRVVFLALFHHHLSKNQNQSTELESGFEG